MEARLLRDGSDESRWLSQDDLENHHKQSYLLDTHKKLEDEDLVIKPEVIKVVEQVWGFEGR